MYDDVKDMNERYIDVYVRVPPSALLWRLTYVYGEPRTENRHRMWTALQNLKAESDLPWCVTGDFNEALWSFLNTFLQLREIWVR